MQNKFAGVMIILLAQSGPASANETAHVKNRQLAQVSEVHTLEDVVFKFKEEEKITNVYFLRHAGIYFVSKSSKQYPTLIDGLTKSKDFGKPVKVSVDVTTLEILDLK